MKKIIIALALCLMLSAGTALAQDKQKKGDDRMDERDGPGRNFYAQLSQDQKTELRGLWRDHWKKMEPMRDDMWAMRLEYDALADNPNTKPEDIKALVEQMGKLRAQLRDERQGFFETLESKKLAPADGWMMGMRGFDGDGCPGWGGKGGGHMMGGGHWGDGKGKHGGRGMMRDGRGAHHDGWDD